MTGSCWDQQTKPGSCWNQQTRPSPPPPSTRSLPLCAAPKGVALPPVFILTATLADTGRAPCGGGVGMEGGRGCRHSRPAPDSGATKHNAVVGGPARLSLPPLPMPLTLPTSWWTERPFGSGTRTHPPPSSSRAREPWPLTDDARLAPPRPPPPIPSLAAATSRQLTQPPNPRDATINRDARRCRPVPPTAARHRGAAQSSGGPPPPREQRRRSRPPSLPRGRGRVERIGVGGEEGTRGAAGGGVPPAPRGQHGAGAHPPLSPTPHLLPVLSACGDGHPSGMQRGVRGGGGRRGGGGSVFACP